MLSLVLNPYPFGTLPRNAVTGPSRIFLDAAFSKNFRISGPYVFELRLDVNNILNHPNWRNPETNLSSTDFGLIRTKTGGGRTMQLQFKLYF